MSVSTLTSNETLPEDMFAPAAGAHSHGRFYWSGLWGVYALCMHSTSLFTGFSPYQHHHHPLRDHCVNMFHWSTTSDTPKRIRACAASDGVAKGMYAGVEANQHLQKVSRICRQRRLSTAPIAMALVDAACFGCFKLQIINHALRREIAVLCPFHCQCTKVVHNRWDSSVS
jgi:hypothetical protein